MKDHYLGKNDHNHSIQDNLANVKLLVDENDMYKPSRQVTNLGPMSRGKESVSEESNQKPCQLREANNKDI